MCVIIFSLPGVRSLKKRWLKLNDSNLYSLPITKFKVSKQVAIKDANVKLQMAEYKLEANIRLWEGPRFTTKLEMTQYNVKRRSSSVRHSAI